VLELNRTGPIGWPSSIDECADADVFGVDFVQPMLVSP
jgi:hypothetical protein